MKTTSFFYSHAYCFTCLLFATLLWLPESLAQINIPDANLRTVIAETLDKPPNVPLTRADMTHLQRLNAHNRDIGDLTGLELATNLQEIRANNNLIADVSPLAGLSRLNVIEFRENVIRDLSPLSGLINLRALIVNGNLISDVSPVADLRRLVVLEISGNAISDFSALAGLPKLQQIYFSNNPLADFSDFGALPSLLRGENWQTGTDMRWTRFIDKKTVVLLKTTGKGFRLRKGETYTVVLEARDASGNWTPGNNRVWIFRFTTQN